MNNETFRLAITGSFGAKDIGDEAMLTEDLHYVKNNLGIRTENIFLFGWITSYMAQYHSHPIENCFSSGLLQELIEQQSTAATVVDEVATRDRKRFRLGRRFASPVAKDDPKPNNPMLDAIYSSDALLITGGGTINTREREGHSVRRMHALVRFFASLNKPIFMSGQTIGPLGEYPNHDRMAKEIVEMVDCLSVRDSLYSRRYLKVIDAIPKELIETFDDAYTLPYSDVTLDADVNDHLSNGNCVAMNITDYTSDTEAKLRFIADLTERLIGTLGVNVMMVSHSPLDYVTLWKIYDSIRNDMKPRVMIPDLRESHDTTLKKIISCCRLAIGGRYHFIVFAGTSDTPFIGMAGNHYSYIKQDGFARAIGQEEWILTTKETWDMEIVWPKILTRIDQHLNLSDRFSRPSVSMRRFGQWTNERFGLKCG